MKKLILKTTFLAVAICFSATVFAQDAKLITYRKGCIYGLLAKFKVNVDGNEVGTLKNSSVVTTSITPGQHTISPKQKNRSISLNAEAGKTYVVKYRTMLGIFGARPRLKEMTLEAAKKDFKKVRMM